MVNRGGHSATQTELKLDFLTHYVPNYTHASTVHRTYLKKWGKT